MKKKLDVIFVKFDLHRTSYTLPLKSEKRSENIQQNKEIVYRRNPIKRVVKNIKVSDTKDKNHYSFTGRILKIAYDINVDEHLDWNAKSIIATISKFNNTWIDINHIIKILIDLANLYANIKNQENSKYQLTIAVLFNINGEDDGVMSEKEFPITLSNNPNLTQSEIFNFNIRLTLENRIQSVETQKSCWNFLGNNTMEISINKPG